VHVRGIRAPLACDELFAKPDGAAVRLRHLQNDALDRFPNAFGIVAGGRAGARPLARAGEENAGKERLLAELVLAVSAGAVLERALAR